MLRRYLHRLYRFTSGIRLWAQRRVTRAGFLTAWIAFFSLAAGMDTNFTAAYQAFAFLVSLLGVAILSGGSNRARFGVSRVAPRFGTVGVPLLYRLVVRNQTPGVQRDVAAMEEMPDPRPSLDQFTRTVEPGEERRNWFDRAWRFHRWRWLMERNTIAHSSLIEMPDLPPGETVELAHQLVPRRRGVLRLRGVTFGLPDSFGLFRSLVHVPCAESVVILPRRYPLPRFSLPGSLQYQPGGVTLASQVGQSEEFVSLREYRAGDPMRHVHWRSWAKTGRPITKEFQDEFFSRHALILDTFDTGTGEEVFEEAVAVAASFACTIPEEDSLLDLMFVGSRAYCLTAGRGLAHPEQILEVLAAVTLCQGRPFLDLEHLVLENTSVMSGCVCVFLGWDPARRRLVERLRVAGIPTLVLVIAPAGVDPVGNERSVDGTDPQAPIDIHCLEVGRVGEILARL